MMREERADATSRRHALKVYHDRERSRSNRLLSLCGSAFLSRLAGLAIKFAA
jgi:hypothetical protein